MFRLLLPLLLIPALAQAEFRMPDEDVPIERLRNSLEAILAREPNNGQALYAMARIHAQAFETRSDKLSGLYDGAVPSWSTGLLRHDFARVTERAAAFYKALRESGQLGKLSPSFELTAAEKARIEAEIVRLDSRQYKERQAAAEALRALRPGARLSLRARAEDPKLSLEQKTQLRAVSQIGLLSYLNIAIHYYRRAAKVESRVKHHAQLGLACSLEGAGDREGAIKVFREVFDWGLAAAIKAGKQTGGLFVGPDRFAHEAGSQLLELLPKDSPQRAEIKAGKAKLHALPEAPIAITPIVIPLGKGTRYRDLTAPRKRVHFDLGGFGDTRRWRWLRPDAALLCWDPHRRGEITSGRQLFGNGTWFVAWQHGYQPLALLDADGDGWLKGEELDGLSLWQDKDQDGVSDKGEVRTLSAHGITALAVRHQRRPDGILTAPRGVRFANGQVRPSYDWVTTAD